MPRVSASGLLSLRPTKILLLVRLKVDLIVAAGGDPWIRAVANATKTIPIVLEGQGSDPVKAGFAESLARPGGNITGFTSLTTDLGGKRLELLKEAVPKLARVAVLYDPTTVGATNELKKDLPVAARALGLTMRAWEVGAADDFDKVFAALNNQRPDGLYVSVAGPLIRPNVKRIASLALKSRIPSLHTSGAGVDAGGLLYTGRMKANAIVASPTTSTEFLRAADPPTFRSNSRRSSSS